MLTHLVAAGTLDSILILDFDKLSHLDTFMSAVAHAIAGNLKFVEPIMMTELGRPDKIAGNNSSALSTATGQCHEPREQPWTLEGSHRMQKVGPTTPFSGRDPRKDEEFRVANVTTRRTSTGKVAKQTGVLPIVTR